MICWVSKITHTSKLQLDAKLSCIRLYNKVSGGFLYSSKESLQDLLSSDKINFAITSREGKGILILETGKPIKSKCFKKSGSFWYNLNGDSHYFFSECRI